MRMPVHDYTVTEQYKKTKAMFTGALKFSHVPLPFCSSDSGVSKCTWRDINAEVAFLGNQKRILFNKETNDSPCQKSLL